MSFIDVMRRLSWKKNGQYRTVRRKLRTRLLVTLIPAALIILALMGYATYWASSEFISIALERTSKLHASTTAHAIEEFLESAKQDLLFAARNRMNPAELQDYLGDLKELGGREFFEFGYVPVREGEPDVFVTHLGTSRRLTPEEVKDIRPSPALLYEHTKGLAPGDIWLSEFGEIEAPFPTPENPRARVAGKALRMITPCVGHDGAVTGYCFLSIYAKSLRNVMSLYDSSDSPVFAFKRNPKFPRYTYFFDAHGWVLFQSEADTEGDMPLRTLKVRSTLQGTLGRPGFPEAFRPSERNEKYWQVISDVQDGNRNIVRAMDRSESGFAYSEHVLAYSPVRLTMSPLRAAAVIGGVAFEDRSVLIDLAGYRHIDVMLAISAVSVLALVMSIVLVARGTTIGLVELADAVKGMGERGEWAEVHLNETGYEAEMLKDAINSLIRTLKIQFEEIRSKDQKIESVTLKEPAELGFGPQADADAAFPEFIGAGQFMQQLKREIVKAAQVDVDVLIEGETGTGKQLTADAVHRLSPRSAKPFISINCGELDENLLLDSLFGHVKGAFTDGKGDRRGAFLEADGGTLFLDEIQAASLKVQQALLRALSLRKIKPLGSDRDIDVNVRLITATNTDLRALITDGKFREDLYYRLKVVTIQTPALREQKQNIPILAAHFLKEGEHMAGRSNLALSRGAIKALLAYSWPGNIRELKHTIITAAVMSEGNVIQAEQLGINGFSEDAATNSPEADSGLEAQFQVREEAGKGKADVRGEVLPARESFPADLNRRQLLAWEYVREHGSISSKALIELMDGNISKRTAGYDIQELVNRGLLIKTGRGPATRYVLPEAEEGS